MFSLPNHLRQSWRRAARRPLFATAKLITLTLGIGTTCAIFALVYGLLRPLPFQDSQRLANIWEGKAKEGFGKLHVSFANFADWSAQNQVFEGMSAFYSDTFNLTGEKTAERVLGASVSTNFFRILGVPITVGRDFAADEEKTSAESVVLLSYGLWQRRYGGFKEILGQSIRINGAPHTVIGILPPDLEFPRQAKLWLPLRPEEMSPNRDVRSLKVVARLRSGVTLARAQGEMNTIAARLAAQYPETNGGWTVTVVPLLDELVGDTRPALWVLVGAVGLLLLISCVNVAGLLLAGGLERTREIALRQAFGASRKRVLTQLLAESLVLALVSSALGVALAVGLLDIFVPMLPTALVASRHIGIDGVTVGFAVLLGVVTTLIFGLVPALRVSRSDLALTLRQGGRGASEGGNLLIRNALVVGEFALTFALLVTTLLLGQSFVDLLEVDPGFQPDHVLTARVGVDPVRYPNPVMVNDFFVALGERISALPGVESVAAVTGLPLTGSTEGTVFLPEGKPMPGPGERLTTRLSVISHDYFRTLGIPLLQGRDFRLTDTGIDPDCECGVALDTVPVVVINETLARRQWPGQNAVGQRMKVGDLEEGLMYEIVGVASDVRYDGLDAPVLPRVYIYSGQFPEDAMSLAIRTSGDPASLADAVRRELRELDPELPAYQVRTLGEMVERSIVRPRLLVFLIGAFTIIALTLSAVGLYGVMSTSVALRTKEFGIYIALGSRSQTLLWMVLRRALVFELLGVVAGVFLALASGRAVASLLVGVSGADPSAFIIAGVVLTAVALGGALLPALRVAWIDPVVALRYE